MHQRLRGIVAFYMPRIKRQSIVDPFYYYKIISSKGKKESKDLIKQNKKIVLEFIEHWLVKSKPEKYYKVGTANKKKKNNIAKGLGTKFYSGAQWKHYRQRVLKRDNYTCQKCGCCIETLHVHHIEGKNNSNQMQDLITLCQSCHQLEHGGIIYNQIKLLDKEFRQKIK